MGKPGSRKGEIKLTAQNLKFIELVVKGFKDVDAYTMSGYKGAMAGVYALKCKLKPFIDKSHELEGLSKEGYKSRLLNLLNLPCVDTKTGKPIDHLSFAQYEKVLQMLKDELQRDSERKQTQPSITAFVVRMPEGAKASPIPLIKHELTPPPTSTSN